MITMNGKTNFAGAVLGTDEHYWLDGMTEEFAVVWDIESHEERRVQVGYYGSDFRNLCGPVEVVVEVSAEVARDIIRTRKTEALTAFCKSVQDYKTGIRKGTTAEVIRGRKVKPGTVLNVFWVGERETYRSRQYHWMHETEEVAGAYDEAGNKVWIKTEYLRSIDPIKSPNAAERRKFVRAYVEKNTTSAVRKAARTGHDVITL